MQAQVTPVNTTKCQRQRKRFLFFSKNSHFWKFRCLTGKYIKFKIYVPFFDFTIIKSATTTITIFADWRINAHLQLINNFPDLWFYGEKLSLCWKKSNKSQSKLSSSISTSSTVPAPLKNNEFHQTDVLTAFTYFWAESFDRSTSVLILWFATWCTPPNDIRSSNKRIFRDWNSERLEKRAGTPRVAPQK